MECSLTQCDACLAALEEVLAQSAGRADFYPRWSNELVSGLSFSSVDVFHESRRDGTLQRTAGAGDEGGLSNLQTSELLRRSIACFRETQSGPVHLTSGAEWESTGFANTTNSHVFVLPLRRGTEITGVVFDLLRGHVCLGSQLLLGARQPRLVFLVGDPKVRQPNPACLIDEKV